MRRALSTASTLAVSTSLIASCSLNGPPQGTGDPGNLRLHAIVTDRPINSLPPHSHRSEALVVEPAAWDSGYHYWSQPKEISVFVSTLTLKKVFSYYAKLEAADGWAPDLKNPLGLTDTWHKTFPAGYTVRLYLEDSGRPRIARQVEPSPYSLTEVADVITKS